MTLDLVQIQQTLNAAKATLLDTNIAFFRKQVLGYKDFQGFHNTLDDAWRSNKRFKFIQIPRNHLKSSWCMAWLLDEIHRNPNVSILYETSVYAQATKYVQEMRSHLDNEGWVSNFGIWRGVPWGANAFTVNKRTVPQVAPTVAASGLDKTQTGQHYDIIVLDDLVDELNHKTSEGREKPKTRFRQALNLLRPGGRLVVIGTPWDRDDLYAWLKKTPKLLERFHCVHLSVFKADGSLLFPKKFVMTNAEAEGRTDVQSIETLRINEFEFSCQYLCSPNEEAFSEFKPSWLKHVPDKEALEELRANHGKAVMFIDPALGKENTKEACDTGCVILHALKPTDRKAQGRAHVLYAEGNRWTPFETVEHADELAVEYQVDEICVESFAFQEVVAQMLEQIGWAKGRTYTVRRVMPQGDKERRIRSVFGYYQAGLIEHVESIKEGKLEDQLCRFPKDRLRDVADALSQFVQALSWPMATMTKTPLQEFEETYGKLPPTFSRRAPKDKPKKTSETEQSYMGKDSLFDIG